MKRSGVVLCVLAGCIASIALLTQPEDPGEAIPQQDAQEPLDADMAPSHPEHRKAEDEAPQALQAAPLVETSTKEGPLRLVQVEGVVVDILGARRPGVAIGLATEASSPLGTSGPDGRFVVAVAPGSCLEVIDPGLTTLYQHCVRGSGEIGAVLVVAAQVDVSGKVIDAQGSPVEGARVWLAVAPIGDLVAFEALDNASLDMRSARADGAGRFEFLRLPTGQGLSLQAWEPRFGAACVAVPPTSTAELVLRLDPGEDVPRIVRGSVSFSTGEPAPCAEVRLGENHRAQADERGFFELQVLSNFEAAPLIAFCRGFQPAVVPDFGRQLAESIGPQLQVRLVLGPECLAIEGIVEDEGGSGLPGWRIALVSGLAASLHQLPPILVEELASGATEEVQTDLYGRFRVDGLRHQDYALRAWDPQTLVLVETDLLPAGARDVRIVVPADSLWPYLKGRVIAPDGTPVGGVRVTLQVNRRFELGLSPLVREFVLTDEAGVFEFLRVPRRELCLHLASDLIGQQLLSVPNDQDPINLRLEVERKRHFRLHLVSQESSAADMLGVWCDSGQRGFLYLPGGYGGPVVPIEGLQEVILATGERARELALYRAGVELRRVPLQLSQDCIVDVEL
jgi:hypothetical protein